jgi:crotonobetainyl-CoA:carnitine CoA-transferase CaiB-like acyl-CoA transferase
VTLRLNHPDAQAIVHELIKTMDVVLVNYRPDVPARFNIDYASPKARDHPQYLAVPGTAK